MGIDGHDGQNGIGPSGTSGRTENRPVRLRGCDPQDPEEEGQGDGGITVSRRRRKFGNKSSSCPVEQGRPQRPLSVRKRKEIQKMLRSWSLVALVLSASLSAAILPDCFGPYRKSQSSPPGTGRQGDMGRIRAQRSRTRHLHGGRPEFHAGGVALRRSTGAAAAFDWQGPSRPGRAGLLTSPQATTAACWSFSAITSSGRKAGSRRPRNSCLWPRFCQV